ncbi:hypothetical protein [Cellulophaga baltica]|uniref:hypothetical protein n=1 Tax=Cellulophaga baltica TaxID=76594 RepID=UPI000405797E|nr:hypothetical protein [Cellulophaga baltica]
MNYAFMDTTDKAIIKCLSKGFITADIPPYLEKNGFEPYSLSSTEKRIKALKKLYGAKTLFHLAVILNKKKV